MPHDPSVNDRDLEVCATLLELAALDLTPTADVTFSRQELFDRARILGGTQVELRELDLLLVLKNACFLRQHPGGEYSLK